MGSLFKLPSSRRTLHAVEQATTVSFKKIICKLNPDNGNVRFFPGGAVNGFLQDTPFEKGSMKAAYEVRLLNDNFSDNTYTWAVRVLFS